MINRLPKSFWLPTANGTKSPPSCSSQALNAPERWAQAAARCIGDYPVAALGAAFVAGLLMGRMVKR